MRPVIRAGLRALWRDRTTLQIGVSSARACSLQPVSVDLGEWLRALDGVDTAEEAIRRAERSGITRADAERALVTLHRAGVLADADREPGAVHTMTTRERDRHGPDRASLGLVYQEPGAALAALRARRAARVDIHGLGRVGAPLAMLLAAAGIGSLSVHDHRRVDVSDCVPGGYTFEAIGTVRRHACERLIATIAPTTETRPHRDERPVTVAVLADDFAQSHADAEAYVREGVPHLTVEVLEAHALIGPFVQPGQSACLRCLALARRDRDPGWPALGAQLVGTARPVDAGDGILTTLAAAHAAAAVCAAIDAPQVPSTLRGVTLDIALPDLHVRHRSWSPHDACGCAWAQAA